ncbi:hypothetical protein [Photorhabdus laumondii]|uniref:hypothetical protein n=1 Tax=Photorhabdus laumondii TaxID=2218628 RepID=UPI003314980E
MADSFIDNLYEQATSGDIPLRLESIVKIANQSFYVFNTQPKTYNKKFRLSRLFG